MNRYLSYGILALALAALFSSCSKKDSDEACIHQVTMDLDRSNYTAVIDSPCATAMQKGGAYFGRAGFDVKSVINSFSKSKNTSTGTSSLNTYMTSLVSTVTESTLTDLDNATTQYDTIPSTSDSYLDAQFYSGIADAVKGLALIKIVLDINGTGTIVTTCDKNDNSKPDSIDSTSCTLLISSGATATVGEPVSACTASTTLVSDTSPITFDSTRPGTYRGLVLQIDGAGTNVAGCVSPNQYRKLMYWTTSGTWAAVATASGTPSCTGSDGTLWPCPLIKDNAPLDLVSAIDASLSSSTSSLSSSLTSTNDVQTSVTTLKTDACPSGTCTAADLAKYLLTY